ncbi:het domain protein [Colletotrichum chrysophilum]|uniref:Het domain protein n=1 Tax=Colletotrichum chrysophilum TaxID=1836956 RepID=A0AAD9ABJ0_9PEZI|nr:het domain protein [Colletotrichum chrysophilum]
MRLLNSRTLQVEDFSSSRAPPYAILSHTWGDGEISFQDLEHQKAAAKAGYSKLQASCRQALLDNLDYIWIDTCCIDKTSSSELSEAINTMFRWYKEAAVCYAFLSDVQDDTEFDQNSSFAKSRWFTRGWTLQELLAPSKLEFYSASWKHLGSKASLRKEISSITGIDEPFLTSRPLSQASIAVRMCWAARRKTSKKEDQSYSLLGIFNVHIPLLYGEGAKGAFLRLQEALMQKSADQTIFAWHSSESYRGESLERADMPNVPWLAASPFKFRHCRDIVACYPFERVYAFVMTNAGIHIGTEIIHVYDNIGVFQPVKTYMALRCRRINDYRNILAIPIKIIGDQAFRVNKSLRVFDRTWATHRSFSRELQLMSVPHSSGPHSPVLDIRSLPSGYRVESVSPPENWHAWTEATGRLDHHRGRISPSPKSIVKVTADGSREVSPRSIYTTVTSRETEFATYSCVNHVVKVTGAATDPIDTRRLKIFSFRYLLNSQFLSSSGSLFYFRIFPDDSFDYDIDLLDVMVDASSWQYFKAAGSAWKNWTAYRGPFMLIIIAITLRVCGGPIMSFGFERLGPAAIAFEVANGILIYTLPFIWVLLRGYRMLFKVLALSIWIDIGALTFFPGQVCETGGRKCNLLLSSYFESFFLFSFVVWFLMRPCRAYLHAWVFPLYRLVVLVDGVSPVNEFNYISTRLGRQGRLSGSTGEESV